MKAIAQAWGADVLRLFDAEPLSTTECWACGKICDKGSGYTVQRAHIVPFTMSDPSDPHNYLLLCARCHGEQPDRCPRATQINWCANHDSDLEILTKDIGRAISIAGLNPEDCERLDAADIVESITLYNQGGSNSHRNMRENMVHGLASALKERAANAS